MGAIVFIDSSGLAVLVAAVHDHPEIDIRIVAASDPVKRLLTITHLAGRLLH